MTACKICGGPLRSQNKSGLCSRTAECRKAISKARWAARRKPGPSCELCGGPVNAANKYGVCKRNRKCKNEGQRRAWAAKHEYRKCEICGAAIRDDNRVGVCYNNPVCKLIARKRSNTLRYYNVDPIAADIVRLEFQSDKCWLCKRPEKQLNPNGGSRKLSLDHDHDCCPGLPCCGMCVRLYLCGMCNFIVGQMETNPEIPRAVAIDDYLAEAKSWLAKGERSPVWQRAYDLIEARQNAQDAA